MAAKGYQVAFNAMVSSLEGMAKGRPAGEVFACDLQSWYRGLFSPSVQAGLLPVSALAGFGIAACSFEDQITYPLHKTRSPK